jgi:hypothetical protein
VSKLPDGYRAIAREQAESLSFHNLKRLMNKVRAHVGFWENTETSGGWYIQWPDTIDAYRASVATELARHRGFLAMLKEVAAKHPHVDGPKLKAAR